MIWPLLSLVLLLLWQLLSWSAHRRSSGAMVPRRRSSARPHGLRFRSARLRGAAPCVLSMLLLETPVGLVLGQTARWIASSHRWSTLSTRSRRSYSCRSSCSCLGIGNLEQDFHHLPDPVLQILVVVHDQADALRPELIYSVRSLSTGRRALFPLRLPARHRARRADGAAREHRDGRRGTLLPIDCPPPPAWAIICDMSIAGAGWPTPKCYTRASSR